MEYDLIITNGKIVDTEHDSIVESNLAITNGVICDIGAVNDSHAKKIIDAQGNYVCPGFIDVHSHSDVSLIANPRSKNKLTQGITTEINGNCGFSPFPMSNNPVHFQNRKKQLSFIDVQDYEWKWHTFDEYLQTLKDVNLVSNVAPMLGYGTVRNLVAQERKDLSSSERKQINEIVEQHLTMGVVGVSVGLAYPPDCFSDTTELLDIAKLIKTHNRVFAFHIRSDRENLFQSVHEIAQLGLETGVSIQLSHIKCPAKINHGRSAELIKLLYEYREKGVDITADFYPYTSGSTVMSIVLPKELLLLDSKKIVSILRDHKYVTSVAENIKNMIHDNFLAEEDGMNITVSFSPSFPEYIGCSMKKISEIWNMDVYMAALKFLAMDELRTEILIQSQIEDDLEIFLNEPLCYIGSDGLAMDNDGKIRTHPHPRYFGTFVEAFLRNGLTEENIIAFAKKSSTLPARKFNIKGRGFLKVGNFADIVIINLKKLIAPASYANPLQYCRGIEQVVINGKLVYHQNDIIQNAGEIILL